MARWRARILPRADGGRAFVSDPARDHAVSMNYPVKLYRPGDRVRGGFNEYSISKLIQKCINMSLMGEINFVISSENSGNGREFNRIIIAIGFVELVMRRRY
ncbi:protein of unknown function [Rhodovastum atsumiense]|nr:protein of unknown function [Rhodovastum atsumiense]